MRYFISISYDGVNYSGWQIQENANTVQNELERALSIHLSEKISLTGCGRTDSRVNAINYIAHFDTDNHSFFKDLPKTIYKINAILPNDIVLNNIAPVQNDAHARFDAVSRTYKYRVHTIKDPFASKYSYYFHYPLDIDAMNRAASLLLGTHDFSSFEKVNGGNTTSICTVTQAKWQTESHGHLIFTISANRFLRNMVRATVGTLLEIGRGKHSPEWISELLEARNRGLAGQSVPGEPLFLTEIQYPYPIP